MKKELHEKSVLSRLFIIKEWENRKNNLVMNAKDEHGSNYF